jgi:hypothetical protein
VAPDTIRSLQNRFPVAIHSRLVIEDDLAYASYYTSPVDRDYPWVIGMLRPSDVMMTKINLTAMEALANEVEVR